MFIPLWTNAYSFCTTHRPISTCRVALLLACEISFSTDSTSFKRIFHNYISICIHETVNKRIFFILRRYMPWYILIQEIQFAYNELRTEFSSAMTSRPQSASQRRVAGLLRTYGIILQEWLVWNGFTCRGAGLLQICVTERWIARYPTNTCANTWMTETDLQTKTVPRPNIMLVPWHYITQSLQ